MVRKNVKSKNVKDETTGTLAAASESATRPVSATSDTAADALETKRQRRDERRVLLGVLVVMTGAGLLAQQLFSWFSFNYVWPLLIIAIGVHLLRRHA